MSLLIDEKVAALLDYLQSRPASERGKPFPCVECGELVCPHCCKTLDKPADLPEEHWPATADHALRGKVPEKYCQVCGGARQPEGNKAPSRKELKQRINRILGQSYRSEPLPDLPEAPSIAELQAHSRKLIEKARKQDVRKRQLETSF
jgi:hypothetical protein